MTYKPNIRNFAGCFSLFRAHPPPVHLHPVAVPFMERPYFFVPRNYSSQITGPDCSRGKLIMLHTRWSTGVARRRNKKVASNTTVECSVIRKRSGAGLKEKECVLRYAAEL